jgi:pantoate--beta-alanine ligase
MQKLTTIAEVRRRVGAWREVDERVALVPTMGNLHEGHLALVRRALASGARVLVSVFVNPTQFGPNEDFGAYPRTLEADAAKLTAVGTDVLFAPPEEEIYPTGREGCTYVEVPGLSDLLCGASRPGHFRGVATVVTKLFNIVQPDLAAFGEKDYQQLVVIRRLVKELSMPVEVIGVPTEREADGLAMSSRNGYLSAEERRRAPLLYQTLQATAGGIREGGADFATLEREGLKRLAEGGFEPEYLAIRRAEDLAVPAADARRLVVLTAARLGSTRLIDNVQVERAEPQFGQV